MGSCIQTAAKPGSTKRRPTVRNWTVRRAFWAPSWRGRLRCDDGQDDVLTLYRTRAAAEAAGFGTDEVVCVYVVVQP